jgi:hypothetical protein
MLDTDPESMNPDPKQWLEYRDICLHGTLYEQVPRKPDDLPVPEPEGDGGFLHAGDGKLPALRLTLHHRVRDVRQGSLL